MSIEIKTYESFSTREVPTGKDEFHSTRLSDGTCQTLGTAGARDGSKFDFRLAEGGVLGTVEDVAHESEFAATAESMARDCGDEWLFDRGG